MALLGFLVLIAFLVLPFVAVFWAYENGKRLDRLSADMKGWMQRLDRQLTAGGTVATPAAAATAAPAAGSFPSAPAAAAVADTVPAETGAAVSSGAPATAPAPQQAAAPVVPPMPAAAHTPRRDDIFKDESLFTDAQGEQWVEFSDAPDAQTVYFEDTTQNPAASAPASADVAAASPWRAAGTASAKPAATSPAPAAKYADEEVLDRVWGWLGENWMLVTGAVFVFLSISWLVRYALIEDIISAEMRIGAGFALGLVLAAVGQWRMRAYMEQGAIFLLLGSAAVILTMFAARALYGFFNPPVALGVTFLTAAFVTLQAMRYKLPVLSYAALLLALLAPAITRAPEVSFGGLYGYLAAVLAATLWVVLMTGWRLNILLALLVTGFYSVPFWENSALMPDKMLALTTAFAFTAVFFAADMVGHFRAVRNSLTDILMPLLMALFLIIWIFDTAEGGMRTLWLGLWALLFSIASAILSKRTGARSVFLTYLCVSVILLLTMTVMEFRGPQLVILLAGISGLLTVLAHRVLASRTAVAAMATTLVIPLLLGAVSLDAASWSGGILHAHALVLLVLAAVPFALALYFNSVQRARLAAGQPPMIFGSEITFWVAAGSIYAFALVWRGLHAGMPSADFATAAAMVIYSFIGIAAYVTGHRREHLPTRHYGAAVLALVIGRLILVDLPEMPVAARIVMFFGVGILLLATAFIRYRKAKAD